MSKVITQNVSKVPPKAQNDVLAADINTKFSAISTATTSINSENVRSEGIDIRQLDDANPILKRANYTYNKWDDGTTNTFTIGTGGGGDVMDNMPYGRASVFLNYAKSGGASRLIYGDATPLVLNQGDLLRIHYGFDIHEIQLQSPSPVWPIDPAAPDREGIILYPIFWDTPTTTPNNMGNAKVFPNRIEWWDNRNNSPTEIPQIDPPSTAALPSERLLDDGICFYEMGAEQPTNTSSKPIRRLHGCLNYIHESASPLTIYQIGIAMTPILRLVHWVGPGYDSRAFITNTLDNNPYYPLQVRFERANLSTICLRKGSKGTYR